MDHIIDKEVVRCLVRFSCAALLKVQIDGTIEADHVISPC
jgi:hypothetical protein